MITILFNNNNNSNITHGGKQESKEKNVEY